MTTMRWDSSKFHGSKEVTSNDCRNLYAIYWREREKCADHSLRFWQWFERRRSTEQPEGRQECCDATWCYAFMFQLRFLKRMGLLPPKHRTWKMDPWKRRFLFGNHHFQVPCWGSSVDNWILRWKVLQEASCWCHHLLVRQDWGVHWVSEIWCRIIFLWTFSACWALDTQSNRAWELRICLRCKLCSIWFSILMI